MSIRLRVCVGCVYVRVTVSLPAFNPMRNKIGECTQSHTMCLRSVLLTPHNKKKNILPVRETPPPSSGVAIAAPDANATR
uniref:B3 n=2 Tax=Human betaherpesvirus 6 TaxID=10368 RepID=A0A5P9S441_9BETA|nr:B3 [Human betaherpesvirus 6]QFV20817.1 B3 [Human betaherpesvirus 6]QFV23686.1 B3 [Human betaherpesvirus 6]QFV23701.1 B3 [Human betaherpesvirus 6]QFV25724.1 B3 [Human betaherpesvirus 6]